MLVRIPCKLGQCQLLSSYVYGPATCQISYVHLVAGGWYLDCSHRFMPDVEESLYNSLISSALEVIELEEESEEDNPAPPSNEKDVTSIKGNDKTKNVFAHASSKVYTHFFIKASIQRTVVSATTMVGSPTATPSGHVSDLIAVSSHSGAIIPFMPRKRKVLAPDTSVTSSKRSSSISVIENVDMEELIEDLMKTKVPPPTYRYIQEFLTKVSILFFCLLHSFYEIEHLFFLIFSRFLFSSWSRPYLSKQQA